MGLTAANAINVQLEQVSTDIPLLVETNDVLDKHIQDNGRAVRVSTKLYRIPMQSAITGPVAMVDLDSPSVGFPEGGSGEWMQGTVTPVAYCVPIEWTKLAEIVAGGDTSVINTVSKNTADAARRLKQFRNMALQTDGTGKLAVIAAGGVAGAGPYTLTLNSAPFGARLLNKGQVVGCFDGDTKRGSMTITAKSAALGGTQTVVVTLKAGFTGTPTAGDFIRVEGVADGAPLFLNGIPVFHQTAAVGDTLNIDRSVAANNFIIAPGVDAAGGQITQPLLKLPFNQIKQELGEEGMQKLALHTHPAQVAAYEEMGWVLQTYPLNNGKASDLDLFFSGKKTVEGRPIIEDIHAAVDRWDYMNLAAWGKVKYGNPPFWYTMGDGNRVFPVYASNGSPTAGARSFLVDAQQYFVSNCKSISSITNAKVPAGY